MLIHSIIVAAFRLQSNGSDATTAIRFIKRLEPHSSLSKAISLLDRLLQIPGASPASQPTIEADVSDWPNLHNLTFGASGPPTIKLFPSGALDSKCPRNTYPGELSHSSELWHWSGYHLKLEYPFKVDFFSRDDSAAARPERTAWLHTYRKIDGVYIYIEEWKQNTVASARRAIKILTTSFGRPYKQEKGLENVAYFAYWKLPKGGKLRYESDGTLLVIY